MFQQLSCIWEEFTVDRFATTYNTKCIRFNSNIWVPGTEAVDAFSVNWSGEMNWIVQPPRLITPVINKMLKEGTRGALIAPVWKSASYWPILFPDGNKSDFVSEEKLFPVTRNIVNGLGKNGVFANPKCSFQMAAFLVDFSITDNL